MKDAHTKEKRIGFAIFGDVNVAGPMFEIHDNNNVYIDGVLQKQQAAQPQDDEDEDWEMQELKFFDMRRYDSAEKQRLLRNVLRYGATQIDVNSGREWFCVYAAERYVEGCLGRKLGYVELFSDIELMMPDVLKKIVRAEAGNKRYKPYSELLRREVDNWYVVNGGLPPINELVYQMGFGCSREQFKRSSHIIKDLYKQMKGI